MFVVDGVEFLTARECAELADVSLQAVYYWMKYHLPVMSTSRLPIEHPTCRYVVDRSVFVSFLRERGYV